MKVIELLESKLVTVRPTDTLSSAWRAMKNAGTTGAAVITEDGTLVGFLTDGDLIRTCMPSETDITIYDEIIEKMELPPALVRNLRSMKVEHAMQNTEGVVTIEHDKTVLEALALMFQHKLRRLPVLEGNNLVGMISRGQILTSILLERDITSGKTPKPDQ
ncbi:MAG: CBS domain-containing protein [bacterium]|nr:CBS domain-containing protein [bacterium]